MLVISHTDYNLGVAGNLEPGSFGNGVQADWMVTLATGSSSPVNWDFESGDLTGWTIVDSGDVGTQYQVVSPGLEATTYAFRLETTGSPVDGIEQSVLRGFECAVATTATGEAGSTARLELRDAGDGSLFEATDYTFDGTETEPVFIFVGGGSQALPGGIHGEASVCGATVRERNSHFRRSAP